MTTIEKFEKALIEKGILINEMKLRDNKIRRVYGFRGKQPLQWDGDGKCSDLRNHPIAEYDITEKIASYGSEPIPVD